jgi:hypothetical protein
LHTTYFWSAAAASTVRHLMPAGNAAPPRPRRPDAVTCSTMSRSGIAIAARRPRQPMRPAGVATSTSGSSQNMPREPLRTIRTSSRRWRTAPAIASATSSAPTETAAESRGT